jgi:hypothetical protein
VPPGARDHPTLFHACPASAPAPHSCSPSLPRSRVHSVPHLICAAGRHHLDVYFTLFPASAPAPHSCSPSLARSCVHSCPHLICAAGRHHLDVVSSFSLCPNPDSSCGHACALHCILLRLSHASSRLSTSAPTLRLYSALGLVSCFSVATCRRMFVDIASSSAESFPAFAVCYPSRCVDNRLRPCLPCSPSCALSCVIPGPVLPPICCPNIDYAFPDVRKKTATIVLAWVSSQIERPFYLAHTCERRRNTDGTIRREQGNQPHLFHRQIRKGARASACTQSGRRKRKAQRNANPERQTIQSPGTLAAL